MSWSIAVDEAMFLGGLDKGPFLNEFEPDFFFDDQARHCESASLVGPAGQVLYGVKISPTHLGLTRYQQHPSYLVLDLEISVFNA